MKTFFTMLAITALATGVQIKPQEEELYDDGEYYLEENNDEMLPGLFAQITDEADNLMASYNRNRKFGQKKAV